MMDVRYAGPDQGRSGVLLRGKQLRRLSATAALLLVPALPCLAQTAPAAVVPAAPVTAAPAPAPTAAMLTVPAGTKVLLALRSGVNTRSAQPGDGVYLSSTFPVVVGSRVAIPSGVYVQGTIDRVQRAGRIKGRAEVSMHFTTMIFANGTVVEIPGALDSLPGSTDSRVKNAEGDVQQNGSKGKDAGTIARGAEAGGSIGAIGGAIGGSPLAGAGYGAAAGGLVGLATVLLTRGNDINLEQGQAVEMVLQRPLTLTAANLANDEGQNLTPSAQRPLQKPARNPVLCPAGGLGCP